MVTLARSVAQLSSELRLHNSLVSDLAAVRAQVDGLEDALRISKLALQQHSTIARELENVKNQLHAALTESANTAPAQRDSYSHWPSGMTNPKSVNKLTK